MLPVFISNFLINIVTILCALHSTMATAPPFWYILPFLFPQSHFLSLTKLLLLGVNPSQCCQVPLRLLSKSLGALQSWGACLQGSLGERWSLHFQTLSCRGRKGHESMGSLESVALESTLTTIPCGSLGNPLPPTTKWRKIQFLNCSSKPYHWQLRKRWIKGMFKLGTGKGTPREERNES